MSWHPHRRRLASSSFDTDLHPIVDGLDKVLLGSEVALGGLDGGVTEQQLDLFQFPAHTAAQFGARAPQIVRRQLRMTDGRAALPDQRVGQILLADRVRRSSRRLGTLDAIKCIGGTPLPSGSVEIDEELLSKDEPGLTNIDFQP